MSDVTLEVAQAKLAEIIRSLQPGEELTITDRGLPLAKVKKAEGSTTPSLRPPPGLGKGIITILEDDDEHLRDFAEYMR